MRRASQESDRSSAIVDRLLTITFTNKGGELVGRVRAELRAQAQRESLKIDAAWISTIHSMCRRMLLSHAFDVGIDPGANCYRGRNAGTFRLARDALLRITRTMRASSCFSTISVSRATNLISSLTELAHARTGRRGMTSIWGQLLRRPALSPVGCRALATYQGALAELDELGLPEGKITYAQNRDKVAAVAVALETLLASQGGAFSWSMLANAIEECRPPGGGNLSAPYKGIFGECKDALLELAAEAQSASAYELLRSGARLRGRAP